MSGQLPREMYPPIECRGALVAPCAGLDAHLVGNPLNHVSQADFVFDEEPRKPYMAGLMSPALIGLGRVFLPNADILAFLAHEPDLSKR